MTELHGFELIRETEIPELKSKASIWRHKKTGAQLLSLENDDENKVFGIAFGTPPTNSTGLPHILEHVVLAGSEKYPLRDPFFELVKGSLATFVNAMTFPDKTLYPAASTNLQDFYNLLDVYADAVFHPLLTPYQLAQEGWHYELESPDGPLVYKGIVFNEMKGAYSSPDNLIGRYSQRTLFPDNVYGLDSGGDPVEIPNLTYEEFKHFYQTYYHPSNALIYFYGDDDPEERLRRMNDYLSAFDPIEVDASVALQPPFDAPRYFRFPYGVADDEEGEAPKAMIVVNWLLPEYEDTSLIMALEILSHALLDTPASPLRKALIDSGMGEDVIGGGMDADTRQIMFSAGLKGVDPNEVDKVERLILDTLGELARDGFDPDMVEASLNTIEFQLRENNTGRFPRGLLLLMRALSTWLHGRDPFAPLAYEAPLNDVKTRLAADPDYLSGLIRTYLLDNTHRVTVVLEPDPGLNRRLETEERERLERARAKMSDDELRTIMEEAQTLQERQNTPDPPEVLAMLPSLKREDLDPHHKPIPIAVQDTAGSRVLFHDLFTNGIVYLDLGFNLHALPVELLPYTDLFGQALVEMGTETEDFVKLSQRIGRKTGGIAPAGLISPVYDSDATAAYLLLRGKATLEQAPELLSILRDVLLSVQLDNRERFRQIVLEAKAGAEARLTPAGHSVTNTRLRAHFNPAYRIDEMINGVENLFFLRRLAERVENDWSGVLADLEAVRRHLINRAGMIANVTLDESGYGVFAPQLEDFIGGLPSASYTAAAWQPADLPAREGLSIPAQVNYVGKGANLYDLGYTVDGSITVISNLLRTGYLLQKIRIQGGAYGAFNTFSSASGVFTYLSYRDPNLLDTLGHYDATADFLRTLDLSDDELTRSIIGAIGSIDAYQLPDAKGFTSMTRYLTNDSDERQQTFRDQLLSTTVEDFRALGEVLTQVNEAGEIVVLGSADALAAANEAGLGLAITKVM